MSVSPVDPAPLYVHPPCVYVCEKRIVEMEEGGDKRRNEGGEKIGEEEGGYFMEGY